MMHRTRALRDKYLPALMITLSVLIAFNANSQFQELNNNGSIYKVVGSRSGMLIPSDTFNVPVNYRSYTWFASLDSSGYSIPYFWNVSAQKWTRGLGSSSGLGKSVTYSVLNTLKTAKQLLKGQAYLITDFATTYKIYGTSTDAAGPTEQIVVTATSDSTISPIAYSPSHPEDIIYYSLTDNSVLAPSTGSKGVITYRADIKNNLSTYYDFRSVKWRRWSLVNGAIYYAFTGSTPAYNSSQYIDTLTFMGSAHDIHLGSATYNVTIESGCFDIKIGNGCGSPGSGIYISSNSYSINIDDECATVQTTGSGYIGGIYIGGLSRDIRIGSRSYNIQIGSNCYALDLGVQNSDVFIPDNTFRRRLEKGFSNFEVTVPLSAKTIDLYNTQIDVLSPVLYGNANYCGIIYLTSPNATDTLDKINSLTTSVNWSNKTIIPASGLNLLVRDKSDASTSGSNIDMGGDSLVLNGTKNQEAVFHKRMIDGTGAQPDDFYLSYTNTALSSGASPLGSIANQYSSAENKNFWIQNNGRVDNFFGVNASQYTTEKFRVNGDSRLEGFVSILNGNLTVMNPAAYDGGRVYVEDDQGKIGVFGITLGGMVAGTQSQNSFDLIVGNKTVIHMVAGDKSPFFPGIFSTTPEVTFNGQVKTLGIDEIGRVGHHNFWPQYKDSINNNPPQFYLDRMMYALYDPNDPTKLDTLGVYHVDTLNQHGLGIIDSTDYANLYRAYDNGITSGTFSGGTITFNRRNGSTFQVTGLSALVNLSGFTTDSLAEGNVNKYFTNARVDTRLNAYTGNVTFNNGVSTIGNNQVTEVMLNLSDITTANASTSKHGFIKKLDNNAAHYYDGTGNWSTPPGGFTNAGTTAWSDSKKVMVHDTITDTYNQVKMISIDMSTFTANGQFVKWDSTNNKFISGTPAGGSGESNTASNLGGGLDNFSTKVGVDLRFNSFSSSDFDLTSNLFTIKAALKAAWNGKQDSLHGTGLVKISGNNSSISYDNTTYTPASRTITINGTTYDLSANRSWTIPTYTLPSLTQGSVIFKGASDLSQDNNNFFYDATNHRLGLGTSAPTNMLTLATGKDYSIYNTSDQTTNYERVRGFWNTNVYTLKTEAGGTGSGRNINVSANGTDFIISANPSINGYYQFNKSISAINSSLAGFISTLSASSSNQNLLYSNLTVNQSGTAGYRGFYMNVTETTIGSGVHNLLDLNVGGSQKFTVDNNGTVTSNSSFVGNSFVKSGGASSQFLKADGSVDNNSYQPLNANLTSIGNASTNGIYYKNGSSWNPVIIGANLSFSGGTLSASGSFVLSSASDVLFTSLAANDFLKYNGTAWINRTPANVRSDLGLVIGTNVQAYNANLTTYAGIPPSADVQTLLGSADFAAIRNNLRLVVGTDVQAYDGDLNAIGALAGTSGYLKKTGANTWILENSTFLTTETDPTISTAIKNIPVTADASTNKYYYWNNGSIARKQIALTDLSGVPTINISGTGNRITYYDASGNLNRGSVDPANVVDKSVLYVDPPWINSLSATKVLPSYTGNDGKVLGLSGGTLAWVAASGGSGTISSGTTNNVPKYTGSTTLGASVIWESSGHVGINQGTPFSASSLTIKGQGTNSSLLYSLYTTDASGTFTSAINDKGDFIFAGTLKGSLYEIGTPSGDYTIPNGNIFFKLLDLTAIAANQTVTFPDPTSYKGQSIKITNLNTNSTYHWLVSGSVLSKTGGSISQLTNLTAYEFVSDGSSWIQSNN